MNCLNGFAKHENKTNDYLSILFFRKYYLERVPITLLLLTIHERNDPRRSLKEFFTQSNYRTVVKLTVLYFCCFQLWIFESIDKQKPFTKDLLVLFFVTLGIARYLLN
jgi:hypothetical protein